VQCVQNILYTVYSVPLCTELYTLNGSKFSDNFSLHTHRQELGSGPNSKVLSLPWQTTVLDCFWWNLSTCSSGGGWNRCNPLYSPPHGKASVLLCVVTALFPIELLWSSVAKCWRFWYILYKKLQSLDEDQFTLAKVYHFDLPAWHNEMTIFELYVNWSCSKIWMWQPTFWPFWKAHRKKAGQIDQVPRTCWDFFGKTALLSTSYVRLLSVSWHW
jgi:hypothetical protein